MPPIEPPVDGQSQEELAKTFFDGLKADLNKGKPVVAEPEKKDDEPEPPPKKEEDDPDVLEFKKPVQQQAKKQAPTRDESIAVLRKKYDDEVARTKVFTEVLGEVQPQII